MARLPELPHRRRATTIIRFLITERDHCPPTPTHVSNCSNVPYHWGYKCSCNISRYRGRRRRRRQHRRFLFNPPPVCRTRRRHSLHVSSIVSHPPVCACVATLATRTVEPNRKTHPYTAHPQNPSDSACTPYSRLQIEHAGAVLSYVRWFCDVVVAAAAVVEGADSILFSITPAVRRT